jgi:hypothetical protein
MTINRNLTIKIRNLEIKITCYLEYSLCSINLVEIDKKDYFWTKWERNRLNWKCLKVSKLSPNKDVDKNV